ncbi:hypothetical protein Csa_005995 [Cucumis sativus]|uniref:Uncharacterized protein n=1 Tax=Cucumis sativus TaxID=3659 RepID=A0A0A0LHH4_CUCSA|nr:hypothetical protein Csa_005995 [Cucumis sativus]
MVEGRIMVRDLFIDLMMDLNLTEELNNMRYVVPAPLNCGGIFMLKPNLRGKSWPLYHNQDVP